MRSKRIPAEEQYRLIMECRQSGLTDHQWCVEHDIKPGTFYNWVKRLRQKDCVDLPASTGRNYRALESQEVVKVEFHDTDPIPYEQPLNVVPVSTEKNNLSVAEPMKPLLWESDGFVLLYKRMEVQGRFHWPRNQLEVKQLTWQQFDWLMSGLEIEQPKAFKPTE